ncbi:MAG: TIM barrel protein [Bryobacteraceae bacterium]
MEQTLTRRGFLEFAAAGTLLSGSRALGSPASEPSIAFPTAPRDRLAVASYPFRKDFDPRKGTMKLLDFPRMVVDRFRVKGIEPLDEHFPTTDAAYLASFRKVLDSTGTHVVNIPVGNLHGSFYDPADAKRNLAIATAKQWVDVAVALGSPGIRTHVRGVKGVAPDPVRVASSLVEVAAYGQQKQIVINLENDDPSTEDAFFLVDVIERAKTPWLRALPDFCNSMILGKGEDYNYRAVTAMFQHAYTISHVKEVETDNGKLFRVDLAKTFGIARQAGYEGYFSMEWDSDGDPYAGTEHLITESLKALASPAAVAPQRSDARH